MYEFVLVKDTEDKKYSIRMFSVTKSAYKKHENIITKFNESFPFCTAYHYSANNEYDAEMMRNSLLDSVEIVGYKHSENIVFPCFDD